MAKQFQQIEADHKELIDSQHMFFTASAAPDGRVNVSPKGIDSLRILGPNRIAWMNLTGSGNETAGHLLEHPRVTPMWCSFTARPLILRAFGTAVALHPGDSNWDQMAALFPAHRSARQVFDMHVELVQTSCGYAVPFMEYTGERDTMQRWVDAKSDDQIRDYWIEKNAVTIDGKPTGIPTG